jgi:hypothetical protein
MNPGAQPMQVDDGALWLWGRLSETTNTNFDGGHQPLQQTHRKGSVARYR